MTQPVSIDPQHLIAVLSEEVNRLVADKMWLTALVRQQSAELSELREKRNDRSEETNGTN